MLVKTLFPHVNNFGAKFEKSVGDEYELPEGSAAPLIDEKLIEALADQAPPAGKARRKAGRPPTDPVGDTVDTATGDDGADDTDGAGDRDLGDGAPGQG